MDDLIKRVRTFVIQALLKSKNETLDYFPWLDNEKCLHAEAVFDVLVRFGEIDQDLLAAAYMHDLIEDCGVTKEEIYKEFGSRITDLVWAVSDEPGYPNRRTRHIKTYEKIRSTPDATRLKLADRIANVERSLINEKLSEMSVMMTMDEKTLETTKKKSSFLKMYQKEHPEFYDALHVPGQEEEMWEHLRKILYG